MNEGTTFFRIIVQAFNGNPASEHENSGPFFSDPNSRDSTDEL
jgi:hypothetical protein